MSAIDYDYAEKSLFHKTVPATSGGKLYNLPQCQVKTNSKNKFYNLKWTPTNQMSTTPQGSFSDFKVDKLEPYIYSSFVISYGMMNLDASGSQFYWPGPLHIDSIEIMEQGQTIKTHKGFELFLKNSLFYDVKSSHGDYLLVKAGIADDVFSKIMILPLGVRNYIYEIPNILVGMHPMKLKSDITLRINWAKYFSQNVNDESKSHLTDLCLMVNAIKLAPRCLTHLFKQPILNYRHQEAFERIYNLPSGFTDGQEVSVTLNNFQYFASSIFVWLSPKSNVRSEQLFTKGIRRIKLCNSNGDSLLNGQYPTTDWLKWVNNKFHFDQSSFFNSPADPCTKIYMLTVSTDPWLDIQEHGYNGAIPIYNDYKLVFEPSETHATNADLHVTFFSPSIVEINAEGKLKILQSISP
jgi:hypothetical protein